MTPLTILNLVNMVEYDFGSVDSITGRYQFLGVGDAIPYVLAYDPLDGLWYTGMGSPFAGEVSC